MMSPEMRQAIEWVECTSSELAAAIDSREPEELAPALVERDRALRTLVQLSAKEPIAEPVRAELLRAHIALTERAETVLASISEELVGNTTRQTASTAYRRHA